MRTPLLVLAVLSLTLTACGSGTGATDVVAAAPAASATTSVPNPGAGTNTEASAPEGFRTFTFVTGSEVRFIVTEELRGSPKTVVATNTALSGEFIVDEAELTVVDGAVVVIDASAFVTDEDRRDGAIDRFILDVSDHPEITFSIESVSSSGGVGGSLTIRGVVHPVVFDATANQAGDTIAVSGSAVINRTDWDLSIPSVPFVANVSEEVTLEFDFVLEPAG